MTPENVSQTPASALTPGDRGGWAVILVPFLAAVALYARTVGFEFVFDDLSLISDGGPRRLGPAILPYRPLRYATYWLDHALGGGSAWAYHLVNVLLHAGNAALVALLARRSGAGAVLSMGAGLLFALHPLNIESVAYVAGRRDLLAAGAMLVSMFAWTSASPKVAVSILAAVAAASAKESGVVVFALLAWSSVAGLGPSLRRSASLLAVGTTVAVAAMAAYGVSIAWLAIYPAGVLRAAGALFAHYTTAVAGLRSMSVEYPELACSSPTCTDFSMVGGLAAVAALAAVVLAAFRSAKPWVRAAWGWLVLCAASVIFAIGLHEAGADRHAYPVIATLAVAAAASLSGRTRSILRVSAVAAIGMTAWLLWQSHAQIDVWANEETLWRSAVSRPRATARAHYNLAAVRFDAGDFGAARRRLRRALEVDPHHAPSLAGLAEIACARDRHAKARAFLDGARANGAGWRELARVEGLCEERVRARRQERRS